MLLKQYITIHNDILFVNTDARFLALIKVDNRAPTVSTVFIQYE